MNFWKLYGLAASEEDQEDPKNVYPLRLLPDLKAAGWQEVMDQTLRPEPAGSGTPSNPFVY